ncbi:hypothetical protein HNQ59_003885 [Chitinivorax tropicus]|uniref:Uncharacterized protein n=1 Tax=Chitinivorax tropicus TaxID=714531 RepID=A0A840MN48_9PROT|nr:hypothetical protein [Chitinivorax tropicus]MBB5020564.1 hypothetical protein [Chitinivorax tropicus]
MSANLNETKLFTVDGSIEVIHRAPGVINLLEDMQRGAVFTGAVAAATDSLANFAGSTAVALYDGEDVEHIAMLVNGKLVIGTFPSTEDLKVGDQVRLVVSYEVGDFLFAHAILRIEDSWLWMPYMHARTRKGMIQYVVKFYIFFIISLELFFCGFFLLHGDLEEFNREGRIYFAFFEFLIMPFITYMSSRDLIANGIIAEGIFNALGVARYLDFNVNKYSIGNLSSDIGSSKKMYIFDLNKALEAHYKKYKIQPTA